METFEKEILSRFIGKVSNVGSSSWREKRIMRSLHHPGTYAHKGPRYTALKEKHRNHVSSISDNFKE